MDYFACFCADDVSEAGTATTLDLSELSMASPREDVRGPQNRSQPGQEEYVQCTFTLELFRCECHLWIAIADTSSPPCCL